MDEKVGQCQADGNPGRPKISLLDDLPAREDAFGPHKRIAASIKQLVTDEPGGKAIALIGTWGGGKSTVLNLLRSTKNQDADNPIDLQTFVFDAWAHEGDPLRRTFLEKLITFLQSCNWISQDKWEKRLEQLARRYKETTTTSTPQLTGLGSICAILLFVVAIGLAMLSGGYTDHVLWNVAGFAFILLPVITIGSIWLYSRNKLPVDRRSEADDILAYLANKQVETTKTATLEESEPTSVEFQSWFCEIAAEALIGNRKFLLAIDNLDRIDSNDALKLWSAMRTFVDFSATDTPPWLSKLWVLAAFDEKGIRRLWKSPAGQNEHGEPGENNVGQLSKSMAQELATTFLDKTFQIRFRIPAPLLSNWNTFLMQQLEKAFPFAKDDDCYKICRIYAILNAETRSPTPRDMKVFVNQIGAVYRTAPEEVPLPQEALYALLIEREWDPLKDLPEKERLQPYLTSNWKENSAALFYSMPRNKAIQVLLGEQVEKALTQGKPELLDLPEMAYIVQSILEQRLPGWCQNEPIFIGRAAYALTAKCLSGTPTGQNANTRLLEEMQRVAAWRRLDPEAGLGICVLLEQSNDSEVTKQFLQRLSGSSPATDKSAAVVNIKSWLLGVCTILEKIAASANESAISEAFFVTGSPEEFFRIIHLLSTLDKRALWKYFRPNGNPREILKYLNDNILTGAITEIDEAAINVLLCVNCPWPWEELIGLSSRLQSNQQVQPEEIGRYIRILLRLRPHTPVAEQELQKIAQNGWLFLKLYLTTSSNGDEAIASALLFALLYDSEATIGPNITQTIAGRQILAQSGRTEYRNFVATPFQQKPIFDALLTQVITFNCIDELLSKRTTDGVARPTFDALLQALAAGENNISQFKPAKIVGHFQTIKAAIDADTITLLLRTSMERSTLEDELMKSEFTLTNCSLYRQCLHIKRSPQLVAKIVECVKSLSKNTWAEALVAPNDLLPLVIDLVTWEATLGIDHQLQDALNEFCDKLLTGKIPDHINTETCRALLSALTTDQRSVFKKNVRDKAIVSDSILSNLILLFPEIFSDCETLSGRAEELVRVGFKKALDRGNANEYEWIKKVLQSCNRLLDQCPGV